MKSLLLHICCAPDGTIPWTALIEEGYDVTGYFYGLNIHPEAEYIRRKEAVEKLASSLSRPLAIEPYDPQIWFKRTAILASEPEGGARCTLCFELQLEGAAKKAAELSYSWLCTTLTISPHKDPERINALGEAVATRYGLRWLHKVWRKNNGFVRSVKASHELGLYRQNYCGCSYSAKTTETRR